ncbi:MAG: glycerol-3-phosphate 1-O-acyltransferase PlsY [Gammaproteobacteria bacterium]|nr:glycerol-3-phosphate 1-O-acyltransferase PlsY [Gammaproteobacteria bacterium]
MIAVLLITAAYLLGSLSSAIIYCRVMRLPDPRSQGSGNPGATNVLRFGGKKAAIIVLLGDLLKGLIPVLLVKLLGFPPIVVAAVAFAAFLGHLYPLFFRFQGGKGVATALGALTGLSWAVGGAMVVTWVLMAFLFRLSSLAALIAALLAPLYVFWLQPGTAYVTASVIMALLLVLRHRTNINNLIAGTEPKIGKKK